MRWPDSPHALTVTALLRSFHHGAALWAAAVSVASLGCMASVRAGPYAGWLGRWRVGLPPHHIQRTWCIGHCCKRGDDAPPHRSGRWAAAWPYPHLMRLSGLGPLEVQFQHSPEKKPKTCGSGSGEGGAPRGDNE